MGSRHEYSFLLGYFAHLITDASFQEMIRNRERVKSVWRRIRSDDILRRLSEGMEETWDNAKKLIPKRVWMGQIYSLEGEYLLAHPDSGYLTEVLTLKDFPDYIDYLPEGAVVRKIGVMGYIPKPDKEPGPYIAISRKEYQEYVDRTIQMVTDCFCKKGLLDLFRQEVT